MAGALEQLLRPLWRRIAQARTLRALAHRIADGSETAFFRERMVRRFVSGSAGAALGVSPAVRRDLAARCARLLDAVPSGTPLAVHLALAGAVLELPRDRAGDVVECGVWKGASTASLSLACRIAGRRLVVCDSFEGLPDDGGRLHTGLHTGVYGHYRAGMFAGSLDEVRAHVAAHGAPEVCTFVRGWFADTLPQLEGPIAMAFLDVDLESSMRDCLRHLWPRLAEGAWLYSDDAGDLDVIRIFFDDPWWQAALGCAAPGFVGSGCGLPLEARYSSLGYTRKITGFNPPEWRRVSFLHYPDVT